MSVMLLACVLVVDYEDDVQGAGMSVLLGKQRTTGTWMLPGRYVELGEHTVDAAVRGAKEQVGLDVGVPADQPVAFTDAITADDHRVVACFRAYTVGGERSPSPSHELDEVKYVPFEHLGNTQLSHECRSLLTKLRWLQ